MIKRYLSSSLHSLRQPGSIFNTALKHNVHRLHSLSFLNDPQYSIYYNYPLLNLINRLIGIRKSFENVAFIGPNAAYFLKIYYEKLRVPIKVDCLKLETNLD